ncbi:hypothetical protein [uncultured Paraglaciecola sp.]|jgi:hypothetical protein|uniref:hypothetical protein n=1 Tax=uncultured Paraglaciecola sp. TaxID=1765024 RepID=UPI0026274D93|nr:hypothetical protein [uncultured Paraglaciecola sp.]
MNSRSTDLFLTSIALFVLITVASSPAHAVWAKFVHVTPMSPEPPKVDVSVSQSDGDEVSIELVFPEHYGGKKAWLITSKATFFVNEQERFRYTLSGDNAQDTALQNVDEVVRLNPTSGGEKFVVFNLTLDMATARRSIVYYGHTRTVFDGGYFYSVDLQSFLN